MVIAVDVGTSSVRAGCHDEHGAPIPGRFHQIACPPRVTPDGGAEHDPVALLDAVVACLDVVQPRTAASDIAAVGVTTYWHGLLGFDGEGSAITPVYLWADTRSAQDASLLRGALDEPAIHARTGCYLHSSYWPAKLRWLARERPADTARVARWGSVGELIELALFGEARTSLSMASATGLFDQARSVWDPEALAIAGLHPAQLFPLVDRADSRRDLRPAWSGRWPGLRSAAWFPAVGDGAASNVGAGCVDPAHVALNVGTSAALRVLGGPNGPPPPQGLWRYRLDAGHALVGGATSEGGNVFAWCRHHLRLPDDDAIEAALAARTASNLVALPFLAGERSPGWRTDRRGAIVGLSLDTSAVDMLGAMLEAVALRLAIVYELLAPCAAPEHTIVASGGALDASRAWTQLIADALGRPIIRATDAEATSRGVARLALEAIGRLPQLDAALPPLGDTIEPDAARHARLRDALARQRDLDQRV